MHGKFHSIRYPLQRWTLTLMDWAETEHSSLQMYPHTKKKSISQTPENWMFTWYTHYWLISLFYFINQTPRKQKQYGHCKTKPCTQYKTHVVLKLTEKCKKWYVWHKKSKCIQLNIKNYYSIKISTQKASNRRKKL